MRVIATAGHVDHGKSTLLHALTGTNPDRFPEERRRGLTIDLGFVFMGLAGETIGFVDVPGHVKFIKNMLAGVGAVDIAMLVVAANEGWMPQTDEHARILELLDVRQGLIVLTKAGLVDADTLELAQLDLDDHVADRAFAAWPVVVCDAVDGFGLDEVRAAIAAVVAAAPIAPDRHRTRLWVDRCFTAKGAGAVVTGTLTLGSLAVDDEVVLEPGGIRGRVRAIEANHESLDRVPPGTRVAVNLAGVDHHAVARGHALVHPGVYATTDCVDVRLADSSGPALANRARVNVHIGSGEWPATWRRLDDTLGRVRLPVALPLQPGDSFVLRSTARRQVVAGATVVDVRPPRRASEAIERLGDDHIIRALRAVDLATDETLIRLAGLDPTTAAAQIADAISDQRATRVGARVMRNARATELRNAIRARVEGQARNSRDGQGLDIATLASTLRIDIATARELITVDPELRAEEGFVHPAAREATRAAASPAGVAVLDALRSNRFNPSLHEVPLDRALRSALLREGAIVDLDGVLFAADALEQAASIVATAVVEQGALTIADIRNLLGSTRKFVVPIAKHLDATGITRRRGDDRIPGPRASSFIPERD